MDERDGPDSDSDWEWLHELCKRPPPPAAADPGARSEWFEELLGKKEAARAGQQPGLTGAGVSGTAARRELPEEVAGAGQQPGPDRLRGEQPGQTGSCPGPSVSQLCASSPPALINFMFACVCSTTP